MKKLFTHVKIGGMELKNRVAMPAMHLGYAEGGHVSDRLARFYGNRARGGAGLLITGGAQVHKLGAGGLNFMAIDDDKHIDGLAKLADAIRDGGAKSSIQLFHAGRYAFSMLIGEQPVSASDVKSPLSGDTPRPLSVDEIKETIGYFISGARRAKRAGFDSVEINGSTGYLVSQFLSPYTNRRTDEYGGEAQNRMRFALEIVQGIKEELGDDYPLIFRLSFDDYMEGGHGLEEAKIFARGVEKAGADCLCMQVGWHESRVPTSGMLVPRAAFAYLAWKIKNVVSIPVIVTNRINEPQLAEELLQSGAADIIGLGRALIADPEFPNKARDGRLGEIRPCIACNQGCLDGVFGGRPSTCTVNASCGREAEFDIKPASKRKRVMVVGAGPAGMEAARVLAIRGHDVTLCEKENELGGQLKICGNAPDRREFKSFLNYLLAEIGRLDIEVITNIDVTEKTVSEIDPDVVIVATGAKQTLPNLAGIDNPMVCSAKELLEGEVIAGERVVIVGGGHVGCEAALFAAQRGDASSDAANFLTLYKALGANDAYLCTKSHRTVTIVEERKKIAPFYGRTSRFAIMRGLRQNGVKLMADTKCVEIDDGKVIIENDGVRSELKADTVVITSGYVKDDGLFRALEEKAKELYIVGDAKKLKSCLDAIHDAASLARQI